MIGSRRHHDTSDVGDLRETHKTSFLDEENDDDICLSHDHSILLRRQQLPLRYIPAVEKSWNENRTREVVFYSENCPSIFRNYSTCVCMLKTRCLRGQNIRAERLAEADSNKSGIRRRGDLVLFGGSAVYPGSRGTSDSFILVPPKKPVFRDWMGIQKRRSISFGTSEQQFWLAEKSRFFGRDGAKMKAATKLPWCWRGTGRGGRLL